MRRRGHSGGRDAADRDLPLAADIGEVGAVGQDEAEADQRERRRLRLIEAPIAKGEPEGAVDERRDRVRHGLAAHRDQQQADRQRADATASERHRAVPGAAKSADGQAAGDAVHALSLRLPRHHGTDGAARAGSAGRTAHDPAAIQHDDAVGDRQQFVELARDQQHADAAARGRADLAIDRGSTAPTSRPRVGWAATSTTRSVKRQLARQHRLLLVAAGEAGERDLGAGGAHVEARASARRAVALQRARA